TKPWQDQSARKMMLQGMWSSVVMEATFCLGGLMQMPVLSVTGGPFLASRTNVAVGIYMAAVPMFLGYLCFGFGLALVQASMATVITLLEPVVAMVVGYLVIITMPIPLGERFRTRPQFERS
ncbi:DMT family transporter, partial [Pacificibacter marinus]|uniref:DMT family transporter n=2 Tax=Pacificibacter TaxID=1042323 RepID=UPI001C0A5268